MANNDFITNIQNADTDAQALSAFMQQPASAVIKRRIAGDTKTLDYFLAFLRGLELVYSQQSGEVDVNGVKVKAVTQAIKDAITTQISAQGVANGINTNLVADLTLNMTQAAINTQNKDRLDKYPTILDYFTPSELTAFKSNPSMDMTAIIKRAFATGVKKINFLDLQMHITPDVVTGLGITFASGDIELYGNGATFIDDTVYPNNDKVAPLFTLGGAVTSFKSNINYIGKLVDLTTEIGYVGATYVYSKGANKNITINARFENIRYGILAGGYADPTLGGAKTIRGNLDCKNVGYPIATYLADDIEMTITGEGFHRVHYIAGCNHARMTTRTKNYYIAPIAHLYSDAKTGEGTSKGCNDCYTDATDLGSTNYVANGYLMGISLSRVDPNTVYDSVTMIGHVKSKNGVAEKLGLGTIVSSVRTVQPSYPANWESSIHLNNITIKGIIDRREQTTEEHAYSDLYLSCADDVSVSGERRSPTIRNLNIDVDYFPGTGNKPRGFFWFLDGLQDVANVRLNAKSSGINVIRSNPNSLIKFRDSAIIGVDDQYSLSNTSKMEFIDSDIYGGNTYLPPTNKRFSNTKVGGAYPDTGVLINSLTNELTLTGASVTWANALPANSLILGISFVVTETITGTSGVMVGIPTATTKFYNVLTTSVGSGASVSSSGALSFPYITLGTTNLVLTARDSATFTGGKIKIVVNYIEIKIPSS